MMTVTPPAMIRLGIRFGDDEKRLIEQAACCEGVSVAAFVRKAALEAARSVLDRRERISLSREDGRRIMAALSRPFEPNEALGRAMLLAEEVERNSPEFS